MKQAMKYFIGIITLVIVGYNAIYIRPLDENLAENQIEVFDAAEFVSSIWESELIPTYGSATNISVLIQELRDNPKLTFENKGRALGIGNIGYFKVKGIGEITQINENNVLVSVDGDIVELETEFVFGNAVRDASGLIQVNDYDETSDFNRISEVINSKIRKEIIPAFKSDVKLGDKVNFEGAIELNQAHLHLNSIEVIPVSLQILQ